MNAMTSTLAAGVTITELAPTTRIALRLADPATVPGLSLPTEVGARTVFDTVQVVLTREADDRFHLTVWRSFASHVRALLDLAVRELAAGL